MLRIKKESKWRFETSSGVSVGVSIGASIGVNHASFFAVAPPGGQYGGRYEFRYESLGAGVGIGAKVGVTGSTKENFSVGRIYILQSFPGDELTMRDLAGICMFVEASGGLISGGTGTAMLLGIPGDPSKLQQQVANLILKVGIGVSGGGGVLNHPQLMDALEDRFPSLRDTAKAVLFMYGVNQGAQVGGSVIGGLGYVHPESEPSPLPPAYNPDMTKPHPSEVYAESIRYHDLRYNNTSITDPLAEALSEALKVHGAICTREDLIPLEVLMQKNSKPKQLLTRIESRRADDKPVQTFYRVLDGPNIVRLLYILRTRN